MLYYTAAMPWIELPYSRNPNNYSDGIAYTVAAESDNTLFYYTIEDFECRNSTIRIIQELKEPVMV